MRFAILLSLLSCALAGAGALVRRQGEGNPFPEDPNPKSVTSTSTSPPIATSSLAPPTATDGSAALIVLSAPTGSPVVCGNLTAQWAWRLPDPGSELFTLEIVPSSATASASSTFIPGLTTTSRTGSPSAMPGANNGVLPGRRRDSTAQTVSTSLLVAAASFVWAPVDVPSGWYTFNAAPTNASVTGISSPPFFIAAGTSTDCLASSSAAPAATATQVPSHAAGHRMNAGVIAGAVLGGFALTALICVAVWAVRVRHTRATQRWRDARAAQWSAFTATAPRSSAGQESVDPHKADPDMIDRDAAARAAVRALGIPDTRPSVTHAPA